MSAQPVVVITGASQGIGAGLVTGYRRLGYAVVANSRTITPSDDAMVLTVPGDIAQRGVGQRIVDAALKRFGRIHMVVNNAGIFIAKPFTEYTDDDYDAITGVNLRGFFELSRAAVSAMLTGGEGGHLVNVSTSLVDNANSAVPSALASLTKGGLNAVTKELAIEYAKHGIRCNAVALGDIRTPMHDAATEESLASMHPLGRMGEIDDVVEAVLYLGRARTSSRARFCTWTVVKVPDTDAVRDALDRWKAAIDAQQPERVAEVFTEDAIFQGLRPYSVGRQGVIDYYASQPPGMTVDYQIIQTRPLAPDQVLGYVHADFAYPDRPTVSVFIGVVIKHDQDGWSIVYYQASRLD